MSRRSRNKIRHYVTSTQYTELSREQIVSEDVSLRSLALERSDPSPTMHEGIRSRFILDLVNSSEISIADAMSAEMIVSIINVLEWHGDT